MRVTPADYQIALEDRLNALWESAYQRTQRPDPRPEDIAFFEGVDAAYNAFAAVDYEWDAMNSAEEHY